VCSWAPAAVHSESDPGVALAPAAHRGAGTVMPTVLFSQGSGIYNYSKIKSSAGSSDRDRAGNAAGWVHRPKLTELITLDQYKFVFGWILLILAG